MHRMYENGDLIIFWDSDKCQHSRRCVQGSPQVFTPLQKPWIHPEAEPAAKTWQTIEQCPSGALTCAYGHGIEVRFDEAGCRSAAFDQDRQIGECDFIPSDQGWTIVHTGVRPEYGGKGIAKRLVFKVAEEAERRKIAVIPVCSYAVKILSKA